MAGLLAVLGCAVVGIPAGVDPKVVIGASAALVLVALIMADVTLGLMCFGLLAFFSNLPGVSGTLSAAKVAGTLVALSWLATLAVRPKVRSGFSTAHPGIASLAVGFLTWIVLSIAWSKSPPAAITEVSRWGLDLLLLPIVFTAIRNRRHMIWLVAVLVAGSVLSSLYGMLFARTDALAQGSSRLGGAGLDANYLASLLVSGIVLSVVLTSMRSFHPVARLLSVGAALLALVALIDTVSRGGMFGLGAALVAGIAFAGPRRRALLLTIAATIALGTVGYYASVASPAARARITTIQGGTGRVDIWKVGWRMVKANPITGVGVGNFANSTIDYLLLPGGPTTYNAFIVDEPKVAHNMYLEVLAELGIPGLVMFLGVLGALLWCAIQAARLFRQAGDQALELVSRGVFVATVGILATDFFISDQFSKVLWIQLAMCPCLLAIARRSSTAGPTARTEPAAPRLIPPSR
ncbi:MAG: O-antigen ligase family protein [Solirubrobacteraceae bacterium]